MSTFLPALAGAFTDTADAVVVGSERTSWADLADRAAAIAAELAGHRAVVFDAVPAMSTVIAVSAALAAGVPAVPVAPDAGPTELAHVLRDSGATAVLGETSWAHDLPAVPLDAAGSAARLAEPPPDATALIVYTSGTTGPPKGAMLSRNAIAADLDALAAAWGWTSDDHLVHGLPLFHVHGLVLGMLGSLRVGCRVTHTVKPTPGAYAAAKGTLYFGVPTVWSRVCADSAAATALASARAIVSGSAALPVPVFDRLRELTGHAPLERYGMTESLITLSTRIDGERRPGWVGLPLDGVEVQLVDDDGAPAPHDGETVGHLRVRGTTLFDGYVSGAPSGIDADGWLTTGDSAVVDASGFHRIVGRTSIDIIKTGGYKVGAGEVETALLAHRAVVEAAVVGFPDEDLGQRIVAFVVVDGITAAELDAHLAAQLTTHKRPREIRLVDALPRNALGKVQKSKLR